MDLAAAERLAEEVRSGTAEKRLFGGRKAMSRASLERKRKGRRCWSGSTH